MSEPIVASWSEIDAYRQCPHKHELSYKQRWSPPTTSPALTRGTLWHQVMDLHYGAKKAHNLSKGTAAIGTLLGLNEPATMSEEQELVRWMYEGYLERWNRDPEWTVVAIEHAAEVKLPWPGPNGADLIIKMKIDLLIKYRGRLWLVDHKSGKDLPSEKELDFDDQFGLYTWGMRQLGHKVFGSIYNAARTQRNKSKPQPIEERFSRTMLDRTDRELDTIAREAYESARSAWSNSRPAIRTPNTDTCRWRCSFTDACLWGRKGNDERRYLVRTGFQRETERHSSPTRKGNT